MTAAISFTCVFEREVVRVEETNRRAGNVAFERLASRSRKKGSFFPHTARKRGLQYARLRFPDVSVR